jgi:hypothetical protein
MKNGGGHFAPELGGHFELESVVTLNWNWVFNITGICTEAPNQKWATHITEFNIFGKKLYLSPIIDLFNQEITSYELTERPVFNQVVMMLEKVFKKIPNNTNLTLHSDQGWVCKCFHIFEYVL